MNTLVIQPEGGICNRLRFLFSMIRSLIDKGKFKKTKLIVLWTETENCNGCIQNFIKPMKTVIFKKNNPNQQLRVDIRSSGIVEDYHKLNYVLRVPINLNNQTRKKIKSIIKNKLDDKYIAIHLRRTDHYENFKKDKEKADQIIRDNEYNLFIKNNPGCKCYLATDCPYTQKKFKNLHKNRIVYFEEIPKKDDLRKTSFECAIIDLYICICANKFKGSFGSSYSKFIKLNREKINLHRPPRYNLTKFT